MTLGQYIIGAACLALVVLTYLPTRKGRRDTENERRSWFDGEGDGCE